MQQTLKNSINIKGIGLHSGCEVNLLISPAAENTGITFKRVDIADTPEIKALYNNVKDTQNCTCLSNADGIRVSTIEHVMSALYIKGIDNAFISVDNQELPIMDGSSQFFYEALKDEPLVAQSAPRKFLKVLKPVSFTDSKGNTISLSPSEEFSINFSIDFPSKIVGHQVFDAVITPDVFAKDIAPSRTFCEKYQVDYLQSIGLIKGGSLENAVVLDGETILNPEGFRVENECVNHKVLDAIGDLYTSGHRIIGRLSADKTGHFHNNELLKKLFSDPSQYEYEMD